MGKETCGNCRFWKMLGNDPQEAKGQCCRYPPRPSQYGPHEARPITHNLTWCGEWSITDTTHMRRMSVNNPAEGER